LEAEVGTVESRDVLWVWFAPGVLGLRDIVARTIELDLLDERMCSNWQVERRDRFEARGGRIVVFIVEVVVYMRGSQCSLDLPRPNFPSKELLLPKTIKVPLQQHNHHLVSDTEAPYDLNLPESHVGSEHGERSSRRPDWLYCRDHSCGYMVRSWFEDRTRTKTSEHRLSLQNIPIFKLITT
jgi:hypothetical protein